MAAPAKRAEGSDSPRRSTRQPDDGAPDRIVTVLAISGNEDDLVALRNLFGHSNWKLRTARSWTEGHAALEREPVGVILCEHKLPDADWKDVLASVQSRPELPLLIVTSRLADDQLWAEVLNLGGYDLLMKPFDQTEVVRVVSLAWLNWKHNRQTMLKRGAASAAPKLMAVGA